MFKSIISVFIFALILLANPAKAIQITYTIVEQPTGWNGSFTYDTSSSAYSNVNIYYVYVNDQILFQTTQLSGDSMRAEGPAQGSNLNLTLVFWSQQGGPAPLVTNENMSARIGWNFAGSLHSIYTSEVTGTGTTPTDPEVPPATVPSDDNEGVGNIPFPPPDRCFFDSFSNDPDVCIGFFDPELAIGYTYETNHDDMAFAGVRIPFEYGNGSFDLYLYDELLQTYTDSGLDIATDSYFDFSTELGANQRRFELRGIEPEAAVDPSDPNAFVTGLRFSGEPGIGFCMMPVVHGQITTTQLDTDEDGILDACDNCPLIPNPGQENTNGGTRGDACFELPPGC